MGMVMRSKGDIPKNWREDYFGIQKLALHRCLEPSEMCEQTAIRAHSIQNSRVLDLLAQDGHVIMLRLSHESDAHPSVGYQRIGRTKASAFTGLCSEHDGTLFKPIDEAPPDLSDPKHLFLIAYRSVLREAHTCFEAAYKMQAGYLKRVERGSSPRDEPDAAGMQATAWLCNAYDCYLYKRRFDQAYLNGDFGEILQKRLSLEDAPPSIAVSSVFSLDDMEWPDDVARVVLNVLPQRHGTDVVFSFLKADATAASQYLDRTWNAAGMYQKYLLSKLILQHCDNFVIAPTYFDRFSDIQKNAILEFFKSTLFQNRDAFEDKHLYLF